MSEKEKQLSQDFKEVFGGDNGKRVLAKLRSLTTFGRSSVSADKTKKIDVNRLIYDEGQRAILLYIDRQINKDLKGL